MSQSSDRIHEPGSNVVTYTTFIALSPVFARRRVSNTGWKKQRMRVLVRDNFLCQEEGCKANHLSLLTVHHRIERSQGGSDNLSNLVTLCRKHHDLVHGGKGLRLKSGELCACNQ